MLAFVGFVHLAICLAKINILERFLCSWRRPQKKNYIIVNFGKQTPKCTKQTKTNVLLLKKYIFVMFVQIGGATVKLAPPKNFFKKTMLQIKTNTKISKTIVN